MSTADIQQSEDDVFEDEDAISFLDLLLVFARHKKKILLVPFLVGCAVAGYSLSIPETFTASTTFIPSDRKQSSAMSALNQLGPLAHLKRSDSEVLLTMVKSRRIQDRIIESLQLQKGNNNKLSMREARELLSGGTTISIGRKDRVIKIVVQNESPQKAAEIANEYVSQLKKLSKELALSEASQRSAFLEKPLVDAFTKLQAAENAMTAFQRKYGLNPFAPHGQAIIWSIEALQAQIAAKEVELGAVRLFATDENPEVRKILATIQAMQKQLTNMQHANPKAQQSSSSIMSTDQVPEAGMEYLRRTRDLKYAEATHQLISQEYQMAKVDEAQDAPILQVLDTTIPPERRSSPKRTQMVLVSLVASAFLMCLIAFMLEAKRQAQEDPEQAEKIADLKANLTRL